MKKINKHEKITAPIEPDIVLFGLIFLYNFGPWKNFPIIKPPISDPIQASKIENKIDFNWIKFAKKKNKKQNINIKIVKEKLVSNKKILLDKKMWLSKKKVKKNFRTKNKKKKLYRKKKHYSFI